ncbi:LysM peptidoglycan-binding domain-containing protein [bacterium]|nr:LysM peptidoglycan-binding domain-containing protein [bacterium]
MIIFDLKKIFSYFFSSEPKETKAPPQKISEPLYHFAPKKSENEISMMPEPKFSDEDVAVDQKTSSPSRTKYFQEIKNPVHTLKNNETLDDLAKKYDVELNLIMDLNNIDEKQAKRLRAGKKIKIPNTIKVQNVNNLTDASKALGISFDFVINLKRIEDSKKLPDNEFHKTPYLDENGVETIGIGHANLKGRKKITKLNSDKEVCELFVKDMLKAEQNLRIILGKNQNGKEIYDTLPQSIKEAILDMTFNKGTDIITKTEGLTWCLKNAKWEAVINKLTNNRSAKTGQEMSGLSKRRLMDIAIACKMYKGNIPNSNIATAQQVYNRGIELLKLEYPKTYKNQLVGYNEFVKQYWGDKIKLST